ncbi:MAG: S-adenosylmethionine:tRNA ribosyltransferase-isomerase [candidate division WS6 bacterium 34_10]|uniref:S-adenosylmethionine:tRNA ribosyltransferase-isomerase n=1 Tax=candidate division WS6 bacterium 34_10 TaxID=1641389 RepID=A0A117M0P9_9BACT|nr:MAG: S-adenosylmethionine:tRNA ribosyltransferase-isomerase [candidate division WS6 bacterium 34_10]
MKADIFKYKLPKDRIAKYPPKVRGTSKLLVFNRETGDIEHRKYFNLVEYIKPGDIVVLNETQVLDARTYFMTPSGKEVEVLFLNRDGENWFCLIGGGRYVKESDILQAKEDEEIKIKVISRKDKGFLIELLDNITPNDIFTKIGHTPIPPYMNRKEEDKDRERYNTVFSKLPGSSAAPTASLNLTEKIINQLKDKGVKVVKINLEIGWGTFAPIQEEDIEDHNIHEEYIDISKEVADEINKTKAQGGDVWAFGTTVVRALETATNDGVRPHSGKTDLYIYPGYKFKVVDHLITNFHFPDSTLILLVSAFAGIDEIKKLYNIALDNDYKFLSYGDSMLII